MLGREGCGKTKPLPRGCMKNYPHKVVTTIHNPDRQVVLTEEYGQTALCCPVCSSGFSHVVGVFTLLGGDESEGLYHGSYLVARESNESRDGLAVRLRGECGHRWEVVFQQLRASPRFGSTYLRTLRQTGTALFSTSRAKGGRNAT